jgi:hypothetical protein
MRGELASATGVTASGKTKSGALAASKVSLAPAFWAHTAAGVKMSAKAQQIHERNDIFSPSLLELNHDPIDLDDPEIDRKAICKGNVKH